MAVGNSRNDSPELMQKIELKAKPETNTKLDNFFTKLHKKSVKGESPDVKAEKTTSTQSPTAPFLEVKEEDIVAISDDEYYGEVEMKDLSFALDLDGDSALGCDSTLNTLEDAGDGKSSNSAGSPIGSPIKRASIFKSTSKNNGSTKKESNLSAKKELKSDKAGKTNKPAAKPLKKIVSDAGSPNKKRARSESSLVENSAQRGSPNAKKMKTLENFLIL